MNDRGFSLGEGDALGAARPYLALAKLRPRGRHVVERLLVALDRVALYSLVGWKVAWEVGPQPARLATPATATHQTVE